MTKNGRNISPLHLEEGSHIVPSVKVLSSNSHDLIWVCLKMVGERSWRRHLLVALGYLGHWLFSMNRKETPNFPEGLNGQTFSLLMTILLFVLLPLTWYLFVVQKLVNILLIKISYILWTYSSNEFTNYKS